MLTTGLENNINASSPAHTNKGRTSWNLKTSTLAKDTINRIRIIVESLKISPNPDKPMIPLTIGKRVISSAVTVLCFIFFLAWKIFEFFYTLHHTIDP